MIYDWNHVTLQDKIIFIMINKAVFLEKIFIKY